MTRSKFAFDMSVPNVATYDPQPGGCCTVMPYFLGEILELPVTMSQDYTLFNILDDYSIGVWKQQLEMLLRQERAHQLYRAPRLHDRRQRALRLRAIACLHD